MILLQYGCCLSNIWSIFIPLNSSQLFPTDISADTNKSLYIHLNYLSWLAKPNWPNYDSKFSCHSLFSQLSINLKLKVPEYKMVLLPFSLPSPIPLEITIVHPTPPYTHPEQVSNCDVSNPRNYSETYVCIALETITPPTTTHTHTKI